MSFTGITEVLLGQQFQIIASSVGGRWENRDGHGCKVYYGTLHSGLSAGSFSGDFFINHSRVFYHLPAEIGAEEAGGQQVGLPSQNG